MFFSKKLQKYQNINHCFFSRKNGVSTGIYKSLNCGIGSFDNKKKIQKNIKIVSKFMKCKSKNLIIAKQIHSNKVLYLRNKKFLKKRPECDALITKMENVCLSVLSADCVPILIYDPVEKTIGSIHAGWRGAINDIVENTINKFLNLKSKINNIVVAIGPCIGKKKL